MFAAKVILRVKEGSLGLILNRMQGPSSVIILKRLHRLIASASLRFFNNFEDKND